MALSSLMYQLSVDTQLEDAPFLSGLYPTPIALRAAASGHIKIRGYAVAKGSGVGLTPLKLKFDVFELSSNPFYEYSIRFEITNYTSTPWWK